MSDEPNYLTGLASLTTLGQLTEVVGLWYENKEITLDGYKFINCRFDNCRLTVFSTRYMIEDCYIDSNSQFLFGLDPIKIIRSYNYRNRALREENSVFAPTPGENGKINIP